MLPPKQISSRKYNSGSLPSTTPSQKSHNKNNSPNMMLVSGEPTNNYQIEQTENRTNHQRTHSHDLPMKNTRDDGTQNSKTTEEHPVGHCRTRSNPIVQSFSTVKQTFKNLHRPSSASATQNSNISPPTSISNQIADSRRSSVSTCKIKNPGVRLLYTLGRKGKGDGCLTRNDFNILQYFYAAIVSNIFIAIKISNRKKALQ